MFHSDITGYWDAQFPVAPPSGRSAAQSQNRSGGPALGLCVRADFDDDYRVMLLQQADGATRAVVTPEIAELLGPPPDAGWSLAHFQDRLTEIGVRLHGADYLYYFPAAAERQLRNYASHPAIRQLTPADAALFAAFEAAASNEDLDGASVGLDDWIVLGAFAGDDLVAAASIYCWNDAPLADVGVLTLQGARRQGLAAALIRQSASRALAAGCQLQYRCQTDNAASVALAQSLGLQRFGIWTAETP